jgi:anthranilate phosphoribosyltransferase
VAPTMVAGLQMAQHAIESGAALAKLNELVSFGAAATSGAV